MLRLIILRGFPEMVNVIINKHHQFSVTILISFLCVFLGCSRWPYIASDNIVVFPEPFFLLLLLALGFERLHGDQ